MFTQKTQSNEQNSSNPNHWYTTKPSALFPSSVLSQSHHQLRHPSSAQYQPMQSHLNHCSCKNSSTNNNEFPSYFKVVVTINFSIYFHLIIFFEIHNTKIFCISFFAELEKWQQQSEYDWYECGWQQREQHQQQHTKPDQQPNSWGYCTESSYDQHKFVK